MAMTARGGFAERVYYVHYTVIQGSAEDGSAKLARLVAGPYTMDEAFAKKRDLGDGNAMNVYIDEVIE